jgi:hypothetical protein
MNTVLVLVQTNSVQSFCTKKIFKKIIQMFYSWYYYFLYGANKAQLHVHTCEALVNVTLYRKISRLKSIYGWGNNR